MRDEIMAVKKELEELKQESLAMELIKDYKKQNKRLFIVILVILTMWFVSIGIFIYYINTTGYEVITETADTEGEGNACVGDKCNNGVITNGKGN